MLRGRKTTELRPLYTVSKINISSPGENIHQTIDYATIGNIIFAIIYKIFLIEVSMAKSQRSFDN